MLKRICPIILALAIVCFVGASVLRDDNNALIPSVDAAARTTPSIDRNMWETDGVVNAIATDDDYIYLGGGFGYVGPATGNGAVFDVTNGVLNTDFANVNGGTTATNISAVISDGSGGWFVGGSFTTAGGATRNRVAHINSDGTLDTNWSASITGGSVLALGLDASYLYVGGSFTMVGSSTRRGLARLNIATGALDAWNPSPSSGANIYAIAIDGTTIYVGGIFTTIGGQSRNRIAKLSSSSNNADATWNPNAGAVVRTIAVSGTSIYAGGDFTTIGGQTRNYIAKLNNTNGSADLTFNPNASALVYTIAISGTDLYAGGQFDTIGGQSRSRIAKLNMTNGSADLTFNPNADNHVRGIAVSNTDIYVAGYFHNIGGQSRVHVAKIDNTNGSATVGWSPVLGGDAYCVAVDATNAYVGGPFNSGGGALISYLARLDRTTGALDTGWIPNADGVVKKIVVNGSDIFVGGSFTHVGGRAYAYISKLNNTDGSADAGWNSASDGTVNDILIDGQHMYIGGEFHNIGGQARNHIALVDASAPAAELSWNPNADDVVNTLAIDHDNIYVGGLFHNISGAARGHLARLLKNSTGDLDTNWHPDADNDVFDIIAEDTEASGHWSLKDQVCVAGAFDFINTLGWRRVACLNKTDGTPLLGYNPTTIPHAIFMDASGIYFGATYSTSLYFASPKYPSGFDAAFSFALNNSVESITSDSDGNLYVGGNFTVAGGLPTSYFMKIASTISGWQIDNQCYAVENSLGQSIVTDTVYGIEGDDQTVRLRWLTGSSRVYADVGVDIYHDLSWPCDPENNNDLEIVPTSDYTISAVNNVTSVEGYNGGPYSAYHLQPSQSLLVGVCTSDSTLLEANVNGDCSGVSYKAEGDAGVSVVNIGGTDYWKIDGITANSVGVFTVMPDLVFSVTGGESEINIRDVPLTLTASEDEYEITEMMLSEDFNFTGASWETYSSSTTFTVTEGEGDKRIYAKVRDSYGNESYSQYADITLDTTLQINSLPAILSAEDIDGNNIQTGSPFSLNDPDATVVLLKSGASDHLTETILDDNSFAEIGDPQSLKGYHMVMLYTLPFTFPFYGNEYTEVQINSSGAICVGNQGGCGWYSWGTNGGYDLSATDFGPMIIPLGEDYDPGMEGYDTFIYEGDNYVTIRWHTLEWIGGGSNTFDFSATLFADGNVRFDYGTNPALFPYGAIVGVTAGDGIHYVESEYNLQNNFNSINSSFWTIVLGNPNAKLADSSVNMTRNRNWATVQGDMSVDTCKSYVYGLAAAPGVISVDRLYVPRLTNSNYVGICSSVDSLSDLTPACSGVTYLHNGDTGVNIVTFEGNEYFQVDVAGDTGGFSFGPFHVANLDAALSAVDLSDNDVETGSTYGIDPFGAVARLKKDALVIADVNVDATSDMDWSNVSGNIDVSQFKSYLSGMAAAPGFAGTFSLYVPRRTSDNGVVICPEVSSFDAINESCAGKITVAKGSTGLSEVTIGGTDYWKVDGLTSTGGYSDQVDITSPVGSVLINSGDALTGDRDVILSIHATDDATGVAWMMVSENYDFSWAVWEPYAISRLYTLSEGDGAKRVYVKFKDGWGNESITYSDAIDLDSTAPVIQEVNLSEDQIITTNPYVIKVKPVDEVSGVAYVEFYVDGELLCVDNGADAEGKYECSWDTSLYNSTVRIVAYDVMGLHSEITRDVSVELATEQEVVISPTGETKGTGIINTITTMFRNVRNSVSEWAKGTSFTRKAAPVLIAVPTTLSLFAFLPNTWLSILNAPAFLQRLFGDLLVAFGLGKKKIRWGVVFNAFTDEKISLAVVRIFSEGVLVDTSVTDVNGEFRLVPQAGNYVLQVTKPGFKFPSKLYSQVRSVNSDTYTGGNFSIDSENQVVDMRVPVDPVVNSNQFIWGKRMILSFTSNIMVFTIALLILAEVISIILLLNAPRTIDYIMFGVNTVLIFAYMFSGSFGNKKWGKVVDAKGNPVAGLELALLEAKYNKVIATQKTDAQGRYRFIVPSGKYILKSLSGASKVGDTANGIPIQGTGKRNIVVTTDVLLK